jgi:hypothetical protein
MHAVKEMQVQPVLQVARIGTTGPERVEDAAVTAILRCRSQFHELRRWFHLSACGSAVFCCSRPPSAERVAYVPTGQTQVCRH